MRFSMKNALVSACYLASVVSAYYAVDGNLPGGVRPRQELRTLAQNQALFDFFILSLNNMMTQDENQPYSYGRIAAIHGQPWAFDNNPADHRQFANTGYCPHGASLFGPWHRPYLGLFEKALSDNGAALVRAYPQMTQLAQLLPQLRMPYWDWSIGNLPVQLTQSQISVPNLRDNGRTRIMIANPLYSYRLNSFAGSLGFQVTTRRFDWQAQLQQMTAYRSAIGTLLTTPNVCFKAMVSMNGNEGACPTRSPLITSLEAIHNEVHTRTGGTMGPIQTSGFEPIFWLHHAMIDRLLALWQARFPNDYVVQTWSPLTTFDAGPHWWNSNSGLLPFRRSQQPGSWWTSEACRSTRSLGYTYPELETGFAEGSQQHIQAVYNRINQLYGSGRTMMALVTGDENGAAATQPQRRDTTSAGASSLITPPSIEQLKPFAKTLISADGSFSEYSARIIVDKAALPSTFTVSLTLGEGDGVTNSAGTFSVLKMTGTNMTMDSAPVNGAVGLTDPLLNLLVKGDIKDLAKKTIAEYCRKNLKWKITSVNGKDLSNQAASANLDVAVVHATVSPTDAGPIVGGAKVSAPETVVEITKA